jgi:hypothetical protein
MGLFGLFGKGDKKKDPIRGRQIPLSDDDETDKNPWQQSLKQAQDTRGTFWNNIKSGPVGQTWNKKSAPSSPVREARIKRRKRI